MTRRRAIACCVAIAAGIAAIACGRPQPPNLLLVSIDTLTADALRENPQAAPRLAAFAAESAEFARAHAAASWTLPSHASILTGLHPHRHGATDPRVALAPSAETLAERLAPLGYESVAFTGGGFLLPQFGLGQGFEPYRAWLDTEGSSEQAAASVFDRAVDFLAQRGDATRPLFLFAHTYAVHDYFKLHPWATARLPAPPAKTPRQYEACLRGQDRCGDDDWATLRALYAAELPHVDAGFGRLLDAWQRAGLLANSVVVVTSDHGEGFDPARARIHHGGRLHADQLRVPLWIRTSPAAARTIDAPVSLVDLAPTLLDLVGAPQPEGLDGVSLAPALRGEPLPADRALLGEEHAFAWWNGARVQVPKVQAKPLDVAVIRGDRWYLRGAGDERLYDAVADPQQSRDLAPGDPAIAALRGIADGVGERPATPDRPEDREVVEQLRALGYVE